MSVGEVRPATDGMPGRRWRLVLLAAAVLTAAVLLATPGVSRAADAFSSCPAGANQIACENALPGDPETDWQIDGNGDPSIQGFATQMSVNAGQTIQFKINTPSRNYHIDILRLGYYGGDGARKIVSAMKPTATLPQTQPACKTDTTNTTGLVDCGNWSVSASWAVPSDAISGLYIAHLVRDDAAGADSQIPFVVRNDASHSAVVVQTSDASWEAYNTYGGNSLYQCTVVCPSGNPLAYKAAYKVSYNRPFTFTDDGGIANPYYAEYPMIRFLERNGYDVSYIAEADTDRSGNLLLNHKLFISSGHDEYWSGQQRKNVEAAVAAGVNVAFFSGNEVFWKTRWENSIDGSNTSYRTLVTYKETHFAAPVDPMEPTTWTGAWADPRFSPPADGGRPANALTGQEFWVNAGTATITVPGKYAKLRFWRNTAAASLSSTQTLSLAKDTLGYEWDIDADNGFRPAGLFDLSSTTASGLQLFTDYGSTTQDGGTATHNLTLYRAPSGALVFGAGTVQWAWGLDDENPENIPEDKNMQQATVNLFADMGVQPQTLIAGLHSATASTDTTAPTSTISSPTAGQHLTDGSKVTISGSSTDTGGGIVAGVEVSTDGGSTWHPATMTGQAATPVSWTYPWIAHGSPSTTIKVRATDDSGNVATAGAGTTVNVDCPCSLWGTNVTPATTDAGDNSGIEVGVKFKSDAFGQVSGIRYYKAATNTGTHIGSLWSSDGTLLASATFTNESSTGWQTVTFSSPVSILPNTTYVAGYYAPVGHYAATEDYFYPNPAPTPMGGASLDAAPLHALNNNTPGGNGVFAYSSSTTFPTQTFGAANYWVDVMFAPATAPGQATNVTATAGKGSATINWTAPSSGGPVTSYKITPFIGSTPQTPTTINGTPPATNTTISGLTPGTSYTFTVQASNPNGNGAVSAQSNAVTPQPKSAPTAPTNIGASAASGSAVVNWTDPSDDGGSPITGYKVTPYIGTTAQTPVSVGADQTTASVTGLTNGTTYTFTVTATNAIGSTESVKSAAVSPSDTIFDLATPAMIDSFDAGDVNVGVKFTPSTQGLITGIRFYKASTNTGTHVGDLWSASGQLLASATFSNESASGWQTVSFSQPVTINAGTTYVASYFAPNGHYSYTSGGLSSAVTNGPLTALGNGSSPNGVYAYDGAAGFPTNSGNGANYWVDVLFIPTPAPGAVSGVTATAAKAGATVTWTAPSTGGPPTSYVVTPYIGSTAQTPTTVNGTPPATTANVRNLTPGTAYTFSVHAANANGSGPESGHTGSVTPTGATAPTAPTGVAAAPAGGQAQVNWTDPTDDGGSNITGYKVTPYLGNTAQTAVTVGADKTTANVTGLSNGASYTFTVTAINGVGSTESANSAAVTPAATVLDFGTPATIDGGDTSGVNLGVKFTASLSGQVTGVRFYKAATNTGTHVGDLWSASGQLLASATFSSESASGWQSVQFSQPVNVSAGTTYVASYFAPNGHYSFTGSAFTSAVTNGPLTAPSSASSSGNGVYMYSGQNDFPNNSFNAANYWVDVMFLPTSTPGAPSNVTATAGLASTTVSWTAPSTGGAPTSYIVTPYIGSAAQTPTTINGTPPATTATVKGLTPGTSYTFTVKGANVNGNGPESGHSNAVTPQGASAPTAPTNVSVVPAGGEAEVDWSAPNDDGGSAITAYTVTPSTGGNAGTPVSVGASATSATVTGLTNGTSYTFKVTATNAIGSTDSPATSAVTPNNTLFDLAKPANVDSGDNSATEVGVNFTPSVSGNITGIRFYKAAANTGTHVVSLWTGGGQQLATANSTAANESSSGWQTVTFSQPVAVTAGTTYVAGYFAPNGHYSYNSQAFASAVTNGPLTAAANSTMPNGVFAGSQGFPQNSFNATNYWVDVLFAPGT